MHPTILISALEGVRRKVRLFSVLFGVGIVISAAVGLLLATVLLDYLLNLPAIPRIVVMLASLVGVGYMLTHWVVRPAMAKLGLSDVAGKLEHAFPAFDDRLRSTVDFVTKGTPGSDVMKDLVVSEATAMAHRFDLQKAIETKPVWYSAGAAAGSVLLIMLIGALAGHDYLSPAFSRLFSPFGDHPWPKRVEIQMVGDMPGRVPVGQHVDIRMRLAKGDRESRKARVYYQYDNGRVEKEIMTRGPDGIYSASLDARADLAGGNGVMKVWMEAGDDTTSPTNITVVQRLSITRVELDIKPPPYVDEPLTTTELSAVPATATVGSNLGLRVFFNKALSDDPKKPVSLGLGTKPTTLPSVTWDAPAGSMATGHFTAVDSAMFQIHATDTDGFSNPEMTDYQVIVRPDQMPGVQITLPTHGEDCTPVAVIPLRGIADDDYGITSAKLLITRLGDKPQDLPAVDLVTEGKPVNGAAWMRLDSTGERRRWQLDYSWDLSKVDAAPLKPGDVIEYHLQVRDNYSLDGKYHDPVDSGKLRITILSQADFTTAIANQMEQLRQQVVDIREAQDSLVAQTADLHKDTAKQNEFNKADRDLAQQLIAKEATAASQTQQVAKTLSDMKDRMDENKSEAKDLKDIADSVNKELNQTAEHPMKDSTAEMNDAKNQKADPHADAAKQDQTNQERNKALDQAQNNQQQASDKLDAAAAKMNQAGNLNAAIDQVKKMLADQKEISAKQDEIGLKDLGKNPEQMDPKDRQEQQKNAENEAKLGDKAKDLIDQLQKQGDKMAKTDPAASKAMQDAAKAGQSQNVPQQMKSASQQQQQNQQAAAQQSQSQAEIGLQMMEHELELAQDRKLAELAAKLEDLKNQVANLIREQSGLNFDNLTLQGGDVLSKIDAALVEKLLAESERDKAHLPDTPDIGSQTRLQEQTEHNSRTVAKMAQDLPDGSGVEADISRAADRMGRAITYLRDDSSAQPQRLATAYEPPQVDALTALEKAQDEVQKALDKAKKDQDDKKKEAIRAAYVRILKEQKRIDGETVRIDKLPKLEDGTLGHVESHNLNQLPVDQNAQVDTTSKMDELLNQAGGIVYVWANKDIVDAMKSVKLDLAKPETGEVTQVQQTQIEEQLQAMIDSLKTDPKKPDFEKPKPPPGGGGGGGGGGPKLPPEAELRLIKALQHSLNKADQALAAMPKKDDAKITALGGRQGQLRGLLDQVLQKASHGQVKLGPEPDATDQLPEEASKDQIDDQELSDKLLQGADDPNADAIKNDVEMAGQRMSRSDHRLADQKDPGAVTQEIQKRIEINMEALIQMARSQQQQSQPKPGSGKPGDPADAQANGGDPGNSTQPGSGKKPGTPGGTSPATESTNNRDMSTSGTPTQDIAQTAAEFGKISPRARAAMIEAGSEKPVPKFQTFIDDYYRALGNQASDASK